MQIFGGYVEKKCRFSEVYGRGKDEPQALRLYVAATKRTPNVEPQCLRLKHILNEKCHPFSAMTLSHQHILLFITF